ncbi:STAS/SEC14 domain-containing protein [Oceanobacillus jordanicus]|uniref:STAS/SEC14 domain-containing protein n=1 Tax=Oceanobacillus jordanicus TaxID=2867266 RepID=A0AAW5B5A5_9BACI|nr:STAS/SEC14 domain-containing protein [Oceanobacillus jordanicus]MCG3418541.1 STAS/SEC14 domain-containing protein [Oceanobacillus jordanicus]
MITFLPSKSTSSIAVEFTGRATKEDAALLDERVAQSFNGDVHDIDGMTWKGIIDGVQFDAKHWSQFQKFAIVSDEKWIGTAANLGHYLPGIKAKQFNSNEVEEAWEWLG